MQYISIAICILVTSTIQALQQSIERAALYIQEKKYDSACQLYTVLAEANPDNVSIRYNHAYLLKKTGNFSAACNAYEYVLGRQPEHRNAHIGYAQTLLALGDFVRGYQELEWRHYQSSTDIERAKQIITTRDRLDEHIFLLRAEWGIGDTIQMLRYARLLKQRGATVYLSLLHESLGVLCRMQPYIDTVLLPHDAILPHHYAIPMISLPYLFATQQETIPFPQEYLVVDANHINSWKEKMTPQHETFNIGICWQGNTIHEQSKFMSLSYFMQLAQIPGVRLFCLQKEHGLAQCATLAKDATLYFFDHDFDSAHGAFIDTAAVLHALDLVITVDTSIAHIGGALGVPTWIVLPAVADWRWMCSRADSPWYTSVRLFRQQERDNWHTVITELTHMLKTKLLTQAEKNIHEAL